MKRQEAWDVYINGEKISTVYYVPGMTAEDVKSSLVNHDGFSPSIVVRRRKD